MQAIWRGDRSAYETARADLPIDEQLPFGPNDDTFDQDIEPEAKSDDPIEETWTKAQITHNRWIVYRRAFTLRNTIAC
jgi:hypothetical protein